MTGESLRIQTTTSGFFSERYNAHSDSFITRQIQSKMRGCIRGLILVVGFSRAIFAAKFWDYYANNGFFWAKIVTFALIGLISIRPTVGFIRWRRSGVAPDDAEVTSVRRIIHIEAVLFALLLGFAAAMARGYGEF